MLKTGYSNGANSNLLAMLCHRPARNVLAWLVLFLIGGSFWYYATSSSMGILQSPSRSGVYIHKTQEEIGVLPWPEERWFEGPRNESQLEKAALIMLVRYASVGCLLMEGIRSYTLRDQL
jgi:hypothetical protein